MELVIEEKQAKVMQLLDLGSHWVRSSLIKHSKK